MLERKWQRAPEVDAAGVGDARAEEVERLQLCQGRNRAQAHIREAAAVQVQLRKRREPRHRRQAQIPHAGCASEQAA